MAVKKANINKILVDIHDLTCPVCHEFFKKAKYLSCHHSYCEGCLEEMLQVRSKIICPECREETAVPEGGVKTLADNFQINRMVEVKKVVCGECDSGDAAKVFCEECNLYLCYTCNGQHKHGKSHITADPLGKSNMDVTICREHSGVLSFYCETCDKPICQHCILQDHFGHRHDTLKSKANKYKRELKEKIASLEKIANSISGAFSSNDVLKKKMSDEADKIDQHYNKLIQKLMEEREQLKQQLHCLVAEKGKVITTQLEKLKKIQVEVLTTKQKNESLENSSDLEIIGEQREVTRRMEHINDMYEKLNIGVIKQGTSVMKFVPNEVSLPKFGHLCSTARPAPHKCEVFDLPAQVFREGITKFVISVKDDDGHYCYGESIQSVSAQLDDKHLQIIDNKNSQFAVSFVAQRTGEAKLSIFVNGMHIAGSPFKITANCPYTAISKPVKIINNYSNLGRPWGIAFGKDGMWAVTDYSTSFVYIYDSKDELVKMIGSPGMKNDQLECPSGIAFDDNNLYVVDGGNNRIQKIDLQGNYLFHFGTEKLRNACDITIHNSRVYVTDKSTRCVSVFDTDGQFCYSIKSQQHLRTPCGVTVGVNNQLYVADCDNHCIHTFTLDGIYVNKFGTKGTGWGQLLNPWGLATDQQGNLIVTDTKNHRVSIFDKDGICIHCLGTNGQGDGEFATPFGAALSPNGNIYICDFENKRIQKF